MNTYPEVVYFDATTIFGGILREGFVKPGDNIPVTDRERQKELAMPTRRTIKVSLSTFTYVSCLFTIFCLLPDAMFSYLFHAYGCWKSYC